jgi:hypothetical protein
MQGEDRSGGEESVSGEIGGSQTLTVVSPTVCRKDATPSAAPRVGTCIFITSTPIRKAGGPCSPGAKAIATNSLSWDTLNPIDGGPMLAT